MRPSAARWASLMPFGIRCRGRLHAVPHCAHAQRKESHWHLTHRLCRAALSAGLVLRRDGRLLSIATDRSKHGSSYPEAAAALHALVGEWWRRPRALQRAAARCGRDPAAVTPDELTRTVRSSRS